MKHAYLILAHQNAPLLQHLLRLLDDERNDLFLHIDARQPQLMQEMRNMQLQHAHLFLAEHPTKVYWGHLSIVEAEYKLLHLASSQGSYAYYHLLSGSDLPLKSQDEIHNFFRQHDGCEFVGFWNSTYHQKDLLRKVRFHYFFIPYYKYKHHPLHLLSAPLKNITLAAQKLLHIHRPQTWEFHKGPQWFSITQPLAQYVLQQETAVMNRYRRVLVPDEIFLQTIVWNSPFRERLYQPDSSLTPAHTDAAELAAMRLVDWQRSKQKGSPYVWQPSDEAQLRASHCLFARKFDAPWWTPSSSPRT